MFQIHYEYLKRLFECVKGDITVVGNRSMLEVCRVAFPGIGYAEILIDDEDFRSPEKIAEIFHAEFHLDADCIILLPEEYLSFISLNRGLKFIRERGKRVVFGSGRDYYFSGTPIEIVGRMQRPAAFSLAGQYVYAQQFSHMQSGQFDYWEFGCFDGSSISLAYAAFGHLFPRMKFVGFDTFAGIRGAREGEFSFPDGDWAANEASFYLNMDILGIPRSRLDLRVGDIVETAQNKFGLRQCGIAHIDCDVYEPSIAALRLLKERMCTGGLVLFDDWDTMDASDEEGERRAAREFLLENPDIALEPYQNYGLHGRAFIWRKVRVAETSIQSDPKKKWSLRTFSDRIMGRYFL